MMSLHMADSAICIAACTYWDAIFHEPSVSVTSERG
jgi:hypothetical protein